MDTSTVAQAWQMAWRQVIDIQSPFGQVRLVVSVILLASALLLGMVRARRAGGLSVAEAWVASGLSIVIGLYTFNALPSTVRQILATLTGRTLGGNSAVDLVLGVITLLACLIVWGLSGLGLMAMARALGQRIGAGRAAA